MRVNNQLSRKQLRKQKKIQKKQKIRAYHQGRQKNKGIIPRVNIGTLANTQLHKNRQKTQNRQNFKSKIVMGNNKKGELTGNSKKVKKEVDKKENKLKSREFDQQDHVIKMYEQKLGMKKDDKKYGKLAKKMGFDDDLFAFLDNISNKVKNTNNNFQQYHPYDKQQSQQQANHSQDEGQHNYQKDQQSYQQQQQHQLQQQLQNIDDYNEQDFNESGFSQMMDQAIAEHDNQYQQIHNYNQNSYQQQQLIDNKKKIAKTGRKKQNKSSQKQQIGCKQGKNIIRQQINNTKRQMGKEQQSNSNTQVQKKMNSLFNKLSDGNLLITFRQFISIFESYPKSTTVPTFATLFVKFNLMIEKPLLHVMSANVVIAVSLHRVYGDKLMAQILYSSSQKFLELEGTQQNLQEVEQIGYSKIFQRRKNFILIICYLYEFNSISSTFPHSIVSYLTQNFTNKQNIQLIYLIIQKCGIKMRNNDPGTLKEVIEVLRGMIQDQKKNGTYQTTKIKFIQIQINEIRFNKKGLFDVDQRMGFLKTFLSKTIKQEVPVEQKTLDISFDTMRQVQTTSAHEWWINQKGLNNQQQSRQGQNKRVQSQQVKALYQLAKSMHFVTELKRNIFVQLMSSQDYIEATKRLLDLKIKRLEEAATVIVEVNLQQDSFNPFYSLVACKIAQQIPKFRVCLQFAIWDRIKQLQNYDLRKISNLGKFTAWLVSSQNANSSLSVIKYFPDLLNVKSKQDIYLKIFFKELFTRSKKQWITRLAGKLKEQKNKLIRDGIRDYVGQIMEILETKKQKQNAILLRRLLAAQFQIQIDNE